MICDSNNVCIDNLVDGNKVSMSLVFCKLTAVHTFFPAQVEFTP